MTILSGMSLIKTSTFSISGSTGTGAGSDLALGVTAPIGALTLIRWDRLELTNGRIFTMGGQSVSLPGGTYVASSAAPRDMFFFAGAAFSSVIAWGASSPASTLVAIGRYSVFKFASSLE